MTHASLAYIRERHSTAQRNLTVSAIGRSARSTITDIRHLVIARRQRLLLEDIARFRSIVRVTTGRIESEL
jgi:hypothetical protein